MDHSAAFAQKSSNQVGIGEVLDESDDETSDNTVCGVELTCSQVEDPHRLLMSTNDFLAHLDPDEF